MRPSERNRKIDKYIQTWKGRGYPEGIPDNVPDELLARRLAPSYRAIALALLACDHPLTSLGFSPPKSEVYNSIKAAELRSRRSQPVELSSPLLVSDALPSIKDKINWPSVDPRPLGVTHVLGDLRVKLGHYKSRELPPRSFLEMGRYFEEAHVRRLCKIHPVRYVTTIDPLVVQPLIGIPDAIDCISDLVVEIKLTWMSSRWAADSDKYFGYWSQLKAYCYMLGLTKGELHILHVNGNYRDERQPQFKIWRREFTPGELQSNWKMLSNHAETMRRAR